MIEYKKGDKIIMTKDYLSALVGMTGTLIGQSTSHRKAYGIKFDKKFNDGHSLFGCMCDELNSSRHCEKGYGYWVPPDRLKLMIKINNESCYKCMTCFNEIIGKQIKNYKCPFCKMRTNLILVEYV